MKHMIRSLEQEKAAYQKTIERMRSCLPLDTPTDVEMTQIKTGPNGKAKTAAKKPWRGWLLCRADSEAMNFTLAKGKPPPLLYSFTKVAALFQICDDWSNHVQTVW